MALASHAGRIELTNSELIEKLGLKGKKIVVLKLIEEQKTYLIREEPKLDPFNVNHWYYDRENETYCTISRYDLRSKRVKNAIKAAGIERSTYKQASTSLGRSSMDNVPHYTANDILKRGE